MEPEAAHLVPRFHIRPPLGYVNDPNGPIQIGGTTHLYFQYRPSTDIAVPVEWGHASSEDLATWRLHRPAMAPQPGGPDSLGCWSGNTILEEDGTVRAYYSGHVDRTQFQPVVTAISSDGGATVGPPSLVGLMPEEDEGFTMCRDPFVWRDAHGLHLLLGAAGPGERGSIRRYLRGASGWEYVGILASMGRWQVAGLDAGEGWECPQLYDLDGRSVAVVSAWSRETGPRHVLAFDPDRPEEAARVDQGPNFYAASAMRESPFGPLMFGWVTEGRSPEWWQEAGWAGTISLPRTVGLGRGEQLHFAPVPTLERLRVGAAQSGECAEVGAQTELAVPHTAGRVVLRFGAKERVELVLDLDAGTLLIDGEHASDDRRADRWRVLIEDAFDLTSPAPAIRLFQDGSVLEVFTSGGKVATARAYPTQAPPWRIEAPHGSLVWALEG